MTPPVKALPDKTIGIDDFIAGLDAGQRIAFGGGGLQRKPMLAASALARSSLTGLDIVSFLGGPEVDLLIGLKKIRRLHFAFVGFDGLGLAPNFRAARESGALEIIEYSEGLMLTALEAAAKKLPFLPSRFGLHTDVLLTETTVFRTFRCPISDELLVAVPALSPDVAVIHVNLADRLGNAVIESDGFADPLLAQASHRVVLTAEKVVDELPRELPQRSTFLSRLWVDAVIEAPGGGGVSAVYPAYPFDLPRIMDYQGKSASPDSLDSFLVNPQ